MDIQIIMKSRLGSLTLYRQPVKEKENHELNQLYHTENLIFFNILSVAQGLDKYIFAVSLHPSITMRN